MTPRFNRALVLIKATVSISHVRDMTDYTVIQKAKLKPVDYKLADAKRDEVFYYLETNKIDGKQKLNEESIKTYDFNRNLPTKVFVHGWNSSMHKGNWYEGFKDAYFQKGEHNVIHVDWHIPASRDFPVSSANVQPVGHFIGDFIIASKVPLENVHVIGKSLGSHVAAFSGKRVMDKTNQKIGRITGLDPAGPKFEHAEVPENQRLCKSDAKFVDIVHTDTGYFGFKKPIGTVDFYPNGGTLQPGCVDDDNGHNESHGRSNWYFLESINSKMFLAKKANSYDEFMKGLTEKNPIVFGEDVPGDAKGLYFFETNSVPPYAKL